MKKKTLSILLIIACVLMLTCFICSFVDLISDIKLLSYYIKGGLDYAIKIAIPYIIKGFIILISTLFSFGVSLITLYLLNKTDIFLCKEILKEDIAIYKENKKQNKIKKLENQLNKIKK